MACTLVGRHDGAMPARLAPLDALLEREIVTIGAAPAAVAAVAVRCADGSWLAASGAAGRVGGVPTRVDTPFDLASVTKPVLALCCARLVERGLLAWDEPLSHYLPELAGTVGGDRTLAQHLSHRAGLCAHVELFAPLRSRLSLSEAAVLRQAAQSTRPDGATDALYSDLGYLLVGKAVERVLARPLDICLLQELGHEPKVRFSTELGSSRQWRQRDPFFLARVAPTEHVAWRGGVLRGVVHDDNAWALGGYGCCGHAGLFGTAPALLGFGVAVLESLDPARSASPPLLTRTSVEELIRPRPGGSLRMGFDGKAGDESMAGRVAGPNTFGHLGFTGTSLWCDPDTATVTVLLTNRVHPTAANRLIRQVRPRVQDQLFQLAWNGAVPSRRTGGMLPLGSRGTGGQRA